MSFGLAWKAMFWKEERDEKVTKWLKEIPKLFQANTKPVHNHKQYGK